MNGNGQRGAVAVLCLVQFVDVLGVTVVITALPVMLADLGADQSAATLVVTGYAMFFGGLLMLGARLGDRYGHRRIMLAGLALFGAASLLGALAGAVVVLAAARCLQGAAAAASVPSALRLLSVVAPAQAARRRAFAAWSAAGAVAGASGFVIGGVLTDAAGWRLLFWLNLPVAVALAAAVLFTVPDRRAGEHDGRPGLDAVGAALLTVAVMGLVVGAALLERPELRLAGAGLLAAGAALMAVFRWVERRVPTPVLPAFALRDAHLRPGLAASFLNTATTSSAATLATLYAQQTRGLSASAAGLLLLPVSLCVIVGSTLAVPTLRRYTLRTVIGLGLGLIAVGNLCMLAVTAGLWVLPLAAAVSGLGLGLSSVAATTLGTDVPEALQGTASGALNTAAQLGTALGVAAFLLAALLSTDSALPLAGPRLGWLAAAVTAACGGLLLARPVTHRVTEPSRP